MNNPKAVLILLRLSIASVFLYAAVAATLQPDNWADYLPTPVRNTLGDSLALTLFSIYQVVLALWIIVGKKTFYAAGLAALTLLAIISANFHQTDILFRDFAIFFAALALAVGSHEKATK
jgi:uncharacterized membrane protein YphA (DoxX/SURF4 family)